MTIENLQPTCNQLATEEPTDEAVKEYCRKRCLVLITYDLFHKISSAQAESDKRLVKIAELVEGTIEHFDREDAMDLLYQIKEVINEKT